MHADNGKSKRDLDIRGTSERKENELELRKGGLGASLDQVDDWMVSKGRDFECTKRLHHHVVSGIVLRCMLGTASG